MYAYFKDSSMHHSWKATDKGITLNAAFDYEQVVPYSDIIEVSYKQPTARGQSGSLYIKYYHHHSESLIGPTSTEYLYYDYKDRASAKEVYQFIKQYIASKNEIKYDENKDVDTKKIEESVKKNTSTKRVAFGITFAVVAVIFIVVICIIFSSGGSSSSSSSSSSSKQSQEETYNDMGYYKGSDGKWYHYWSSYD